jgi:hypothetical protein
VALEPERARHPSAREVRVQQEAHV